MNAKLLMDEAIEARKYAYAPYSGYAVGAALLSKSGKVFHGCNIENAAYSPTNCAERTAVFSAVAQGEKDFVAIAVVGGKGDALDETITPCGVCRQVLSEFCSKDFQLILGTPDSFRIVSLGELLPESFSL